MTLHSILSGQLQDLQSRAVADSAVGECAAQREREQRMMMMRKFQLKDKPMMKKRVMRMRMSKMRIGLKKEREILRLTLQKQIQRQQKLIPVFLLVLTFLLTLMRDSLEPVLLFPLILLRDHQSLSIALLQLLAIPSQFLLS